MSQDKKLKDHKQIGQEQELFFNSEYSPGAVFWLPNGMVIVKELEKYIRELTEKAGYVETSTPILVKSQLFKESGHWEKFGERNMYSFTVTEEGEQEGTSYTLKPMNCPESTIIYRFRPRSYRELPLRLAELGRLFRREKSGEIGGLLRVRQLTMDDAHIYTTEDQIFDEIGNILDMMISFYTSFGFTFDFRLATRPEFFAGTTSNWNRAEKDLEEALKKKQLTYSLKEKEGAFYGPKIDVHIKDSLGREWQLATVQLDFHQPEAFRLTYVDSDGKEKRPVMIHRAIFGSFERFIGILTEHYQGKFPVWLAPVQVVVIPISDRHLEHAKTLNSQLSNPRPELGSKALNFRSTIDDRAETMQAKIRDATLQKVPFMGIIGDREVANKKVSARTQEGEDLGQMDTSSFIQRVRESIEKKI